MRKKLYKRLLILAVILYASFTLINQQKELNQYNKNNNQKLLAEKENVDSKEFIEETAREKLDMYYPNEKVYIDSGF